MAKLRSNHAGNSNPFVGLWVRVFVLLIIVAALFYWIWSYFSGPLQYETGESQVYERGYLIPEGQDVEVVHHAYFSLGYSEADEQASWVCYVLNKDELRMPNVERSDWYEADDKVRTGSAHHRDYSGSGYTRGHLAPAGDMAFNQTAMEESFLMSNISPQLRAFNGGIWRELEENLRDWAFHRGRLYVVTGPILNTGGRQMGKFGDITIPSYFYKVIIDMDNGDPQGIGFIIPNELSMKPLMDFAVSINEVEERTRLDFFSLLLSDEETEEKVESYLEVNNWPISEKRFKLRLEEWNIN